MQDIIDMKQFVSSLALGLTNPASSSQMSCARTAYTSSVLTTQLTASQPLPGQANISFVQSSGTTTLLQSNEAFCLLGDEQSLNISVTPRLTHYYEQVNTVLIDISPFFEISEVTLSNPVAYNCRGVLPTICDVSWTKAPPKTTMCVQSTLNVVQEDIPGNCGFYAFTTNVWCDPYPKVRYRVSCATDYKIATTNRVVSTAMEHCATYSMSLGTWNKSGTKCALSGTALILTNEDDPGRLAITTTIIPFTKPDDLVVYDNKVYNKPAKWEGDGLTTAGGVRGTTLAGAQVKLKTLLAEAMSLKETRVLMYASKPTFENVDIEFDLVNLVGYRYPEQVGVAIIESPILNVTRLAHVGGVIRMFRCPMSQGLEKPLALCEYICSSIGEVSNLGCEHGIRLFCDTIDEVLNFKFQIGLGINTLCVNVGAVCQCSDVNGTEVVTQEGGDVYHNVTTLPPVSGLDNRGSDDGDSLLKYVVYVGSSLASLASLGVVFMFNYGLVAMNLGLALILLLTNYKDWIVVGMAIFIIAVTALTVSWRCRKAKSIDIENTETEKSKTHHRARKQFPGSVDLRTSIDKLSWVIDPTRWTGHPDQRSTRRSATELKGPDTHELQSVVITENIPVSGTSNEE